MTFSIATDVVGTTLAESSGTSGKLGGDGGVGGNPIGQCIFAVLDDGFGGFVSVVGSARLPRGDGGVVDEFEEVLSKTGDDG